MILGALAEAEVWSLRSTTLIRHSLQYTNLVHCLLSSLYMAVSRD